MKVTFFILSLISLGTVLFLGLNISFKFYWLLLLIVPLILLGIYDIFQTKHAIRRNFPIIGRSRYIAEWLRPKIYQYFVESDIDGKPFSRIYRSIIYQRAKKELDTSPFGTQLDVYSSDYEWMNHSIAPHAYDTREAPRIVIGGPQCLQPYSASILNISAMSFGSLSAAAIKALNGGAALGNFAHNTGEGGVSPYHLEFKVDLVFQFGTGYFGCRGKDGGFSPALFRKSANLPSVKMIEIKLSQGAKPGHGGILPAKKVTPEIAAIRNIEPYKDVNSPSSHKTFQTPRQLLEFVQNLREHSGGKPIGIKLCVGHKHEFLALCKAMISTGIKVDYIAVDGGEGGTGAAPLEFSDSVGMPYQDALAFVYNALIGFDLKKDIKIIASGKISTGFQIYKAIAIGADLCYSARAMMMALGCIQALECNKNTCPVGVATQSKHLMRGLVVEDKKTRVKNFHDETVKSFMELLYASGLSIPDDINRSHMMTRTKNYQAMSYEIKYPYIAKGCLLDYHSIPHDWVEDMSKADPDSFKARYEEVYTE